MSCRLLSTMEAKLDNTMNQSVVVFAIYSKNTCFNLQKTNVTNQNDLVCSSNVVCVAFRVSY